MSQRNWQAKWIAHPTSHIPFAPQPMIEEGEQNAYYLFRRDFNLQEDPGEVEMAITGSSWYRVYINGVFVEYGPVQSAVFYKYYNCREVGALLKRGHNTIAVELHVTGKTFPAALLLELKQHGQIILEATSAQWKCCHAEAWKIDSPFFAPSLYCPWQEKFDARKMPKGWKEYGFDDSDWQYAQVYSTRGEDTPPAVSPWLLLVERDIPYLKTEIRYPKTVLELTENVHIRSRHRRPEDMSISLSVQGRTPELCRFEQPETLCSGSGVCSVSGYGNALGGTVYDPAILLDFGIIIRAFAELEVEGPAGTRIEIGYAEDLVDGHFNNAVGNIFADCVYLDGTRMVFRPFVWKAFRYLKLRIYGVPPYTVKIHALRAVCERYPFRHANAFQTEEHRLQAIYNMCAYTVDLCTSDNIFDTPYREQGQWLYDTCGVTLNSLLWGFGEVTMCRKYLKQTMHLMVPTGTFAAISNYSGAGGGWKEYNDRGLLYPSALWDYFLYSGDDSLLFECYPQLLSNLDFFRSYVNESGLIANLPSTFLDWGYNFSVCDDARKGISAPVNALFMRMLETMEKICRRYGDNFRIRQISELQKELKSAYMKTFWVPERGGICDSVRHGKKSGVISEYANALALLAELPEAEEREIILRNVFETGSANVLEASSFSTAFVLKALAANGRFDCAMRIVRERWGTRWADKGYTSTPEMWAFPFCNGDFSAQASHSHVWSSGVCEFLTRCLLGLEIVSPGFEEIRMNPQTPDHDCTVCLLTPHGVLRAENRSGKWSFEIPDAIRVIPAASV